MKHFLDAIGALLYLVFKILFLPFYVLLQVLFAVSDAVHFTRMQLLKLRAFKLRLHLPSLHVFKYGFNYIKLHTTRTLFK